MGAIWRLLSLQSGSALRNTAAGAIAVMAIGLFGRVLSYPVQDDENIHIATALLLSDHHIYRDLGFVHLPNLPLILNAIFSLSGTDHYVLAGRLLVCLAWVGAAAALGLIAWQKTKSPAVVTTVVILLMTNTLLLGPAGMLVTNNLLPITVSLFGFYFFIRGMDEYRRRPWLFFLSGLCISVAIGLKVNNIFLVPPFAAAAFLAPAGQPFGARLKHAVLSMIAGGVVGGLPALYYLVQEPDGFLAHTLRYFTYAHHDYWQTLDEPKVMGMAGKLQIAEQMWLGGATLLAACLALYQFFVPLSSRERPYGHVATGWLLWLTIGLIALGAAVSFIPTPAFSQYFTPPVAFVIVLVIVTHARLDGRERRLALPLMAAVVALSMVAGASRLVPGIPAFFMPHKWTGLVVHDEARAALDQIGGTAAPRVATLWPIHALEGGGTIYPEFAAGPFVYRIADYIPAADRRHFRTTSASQIPAFLDADPPQAIIVKNNGRSDGELRDYAIANGYRPVPLDRSGELRLLVRPDSGKK